MSNKILVIGVLALWCVNVYVLFQIWKKAKSVDDTLAPVRNLIGGFVKI